MTPPTRNKAQYRVLVLWADHNSTNLGVRVLADGNAELARSVQPDARVDFQSYGEGPSPRNIGLKALILGYMRLDRRLTAWLRSYDLVVDSGAGDSFADIYGLRRLAEMSLLRRIAIRAGTPLILGPQTIGPFESRTGRFLARWSTRGATLIFARDTQSFRIAPSYGLTELSQSVDTVFNLPTVDSKRTDLDVVINVSGLLWRDNSHVDWHKYRQDVRALITELRSQGRKVALLAHVVGSDDADDDEAIMTEVISTLSDDIRDCEIIVPRDLTEARETLAGARVVIGARMHACLNALSLGVPAIAWAYSRKFAPLLADLNWPYVLDLKDPEIDVVGETIAFIREIATNEGPAAADTTKTGRSSAAAAHLVLQRKLDGKNP